MSKFTRKFIFDELDMLCDALGGRVPTKKEFMEYSESRYACISIFGSYNNMLIAAGKTPNRVVRKKKSVVVKEEVPTSIPAETTPVKKAIRHVTDAEIIQDIQRCAVEHPEIKSPITLLKEFGKHGMETYRRHIGNAPQLEPIIEKARESMIRKSVYTKRYPIKYSSSAIILKWVHKHVN